MPRMACMSLKYSRKEQKVHNCPVCGEKTEGTYSEGGINFALCENCYREKYQEETERSYQNEHNKPIIPAG